MFIQMLVIGHGGAIHIKVSDTHIWSSRQNMTGIPALAFGIAADMADG